MEYYIAAGQQRLGPFTIEQLATHGLQANTLVWCEGMPQWAPASTVPELFPLFSAPLASGSPQQQSIAYAQPGSTFVPPFVPGNSNRVAAGVCGILVGAFGVHKFIAGLNTGAVIMLCVSLGGFVFGASCCFMIVLGPVTMSIIGLTEGIMYLSCTDEEFYVRYVVQKRQWF